MTTPWPRIHIRGNGYNLKLDVFDIVDAASYELKSRCILSYFQRRSTCIKSEESVALSLQSTNLHYRFTSKPYLSIAFSQHCVLSFLYHSHYLLLLVVATPPSLPKYSKAIINSWKWLHSPASLLRSPLPALAAPSPWTASVRATCPQACPRWELKCPLELSPVALLSLPATWAVMDTAVLALVVSLAPVE